MNGVDSSEEDLLIDRRPIITCAGELEVFSALEDALSQALPQESSEWRRSLGRPIRSVHVGASFTPFSPAALPRGNQWDLIKQPLFHIYWTECTDIDLYKTNVREDIETWVKEITSRDIPDWLIVVVENYDGKRANKLLPRTTVLDKIRADFAPKQGDRCISVINPGRSESRSADSWRGLMARIRHLVLIAYARAVGKLEDHVRQQRERRNEAEWNFMQYFQLQEELAQVLEMLGLHEEALVQYDELDALFSQFVVNGHVGDSANWLSEFQKSLNRWHGLRLGTCRLKNNPSLLELRSYLFAKQAYMLLETNKIWEVASRCLPFLHTCLRELALLDITLPAGAASCWLFLACMEILQACNKFNQAEQIEAYSLHTASLWAYASQKLRELGELCGLMPGGTPTSAQLHIVVGLSAGMGDCPGQLGQPSPTDKLKEALSSQDVFIKNYLELAELAVGTYKHIGRLRSARLIGREVASFYMLLGETQKAAAFLGDALRTFEQDGWHELAAQTQIELAECFKRANDNRKYVRACAAVSAAPEIDNLIRWTYFDEMCKSLSELNDPLTVPFEDVIKIVSVSVKNDGIVMQDSNINVELTVDSNFPREMLCTSVMVSLETNTKDQKKTKEKTNAQLWTVTMKDKSRDVSMQRLRIERHLDYKQDKQLASASVVCKTTSLKRKDSAAAPQLSDFQLYVEIKKKPLVLTPGVNIIRLTKLAVNVDRYYLGQVAIHSGNLHLLSTPLTPKLFIEVKRQEPVLRLDKGTLPLLCGIEQVMQLTLTVGSYKIEPIFVIKLVTSRGLMIQHHQNMSLVSSLDIEIEQTNPHSVTEIPLRVLAELQTKEHQVTMICPWATKPIPVTLSFTRPMAISWRLHTTRHRKFIQITVMGQSEQKLILSSPKLNISNDVTVADLNSTETSSQIISSGFSILYLWELLITASADSPLIKADFSIEYSAFYGENESGDTEIRTYHYNFDITDYQTLYLVEAQIEPTKGSDFCRVGAVCHLNLLIKPTGHCLDSNKLSTTSIMYEVLAEQSIWAVCGRTAGVVSFETDCEPQSVVLDVMPLTSGFLPLPLIRLSKYIPAELSTPDKPRKPETHPRLEPFSPGQVHNGMKGQQVHVIAGVNEGHAA